MKVLIGINADETKKIRKIAVLTGTRAEYGVLKPLIKKIGSDKNLRRDLIITGMHMSGKHGYTFNDIVKDGVKNYHTAPMNMNEDSAFGMAQYVSEGIKNISKCLDKIKPDILVILGDRTEALAGAISAAYMNIIIAHISGGDITKGGLDEPTRHAITRFAHIHFPISRKSAERIIRSGEEKYRVYNFGSPSIDSIKETKLLPKRILSRKFGINFEEPFLLMIQHPVTTEPKESEKQIIETLKAIHELNFQTIIIYPNSDAGCASIIKKIDEAKNDRIKVYKNLRHEEYLSLLKHASVLVGNSSSGIIEAPYFKVPVVNIGIRQEGRERANNIIDVSHNKEEIINAIKKSMSKKFKDKLKMCKSPYGDGKSSGNIVKALREIRIDKKLLQKQLNFK